MKATTSVPNLPDHDVWVLRELAREYTELLAAPAQAEKIALWKTTNRLEPVRPMILLSNDAWDQTLEDSIFVCADDWAREQERWLRRHLWVGRHLQDDFVFDDTVYVPVVVRRGSWGVQANWVRPDHTFGAAHFEPVICREADAEQLHIPEITVDWEETGRNVERAAAVYEGILPVQPRGTSFFWFAIFDEFIQWRGLGPAFLDMVDRPAWLHGILNLMTEGALAELEALEAAGALALNNGANGTPGVGPNGLGFTDCLPQPDFDGTHVRPRDLWGHATTQIFADVSPAMHEEFALQYEGRFLERFGLASYGCCEPLHRKVDLIFKYIPHLRKLSMSPWVDVAQGAEALGRRAVFCYKPNPALLSGENWDKEHVRAGLREVLDKTRGCVVEIIMKDLHNCHHQPQRMTDWVDIAMQLAQSGEW
jgi:hypothetical protein